MSKKVSVIMPVYLGEYQGCASDREQKFLRAVSSVLQSSYKNIELVVIGDSCSITEKLIKKKEIVEIFSNENFINVTSSYENSENKDV